MIRFSIYYIKKIRAYGACPLLENLVYKAGFPVAPLKNSYLYYWTVTGRLLDSYFLVLKKL